MTRMDALRRLYRKARWSVLVVAAAAASARAAVQADPDAGWAGSLRAVRTAMAQRRKPKRQARPTVLRAATPALTPTPAPAYKTPASSPSPSPLPQGGEEFRRVDEIDLAKAYNRHLKTRFQFSANGWTVYATGALDPSNPDGSFLVLHVEDHGDIVFDILSVLNDYKRPRPFAVNGMPLVLRGEPTFWNSDRDSKIFVHKNKGSMAEPEPGEKVLEVMVIDLKKALFELGTPIHAGGQDIRLFYGDAVTKGEKRYQMGPGRGFAFVRRVKDDEFAKPVVVDEAKLTAGASLSVPISKETTLRLERAGEDVLKIIQEN